MKRYDLQRRPLGLALWLIVAHLFGGLPGLLPPASALASEHDYVISNGSGAAVRADLNSALAAIASKNSKTTAPSTTYAFMWWFDTTAGLLKIRDASNANWVTVASLSGTTWVPYRSGAALGDAVINAGSTPSISAGVAGSRPAAGTAGRLYFSTDTAVVERDTGAAWVGITGKPSALQVFTASGTYTKPSGLKSALVLVLGGGSGAGGVGTSSGNTAAAGAAGGIAIKRIAAASIGGTETVTIGAGGAGGSAAGGNSTAGGTTSFGAHCSATGGASALGATAGVVRTGGTLGGVGSGGDLNTTGAIADSPMIGTSGANGASSPFGGGGNAVAAAAGTNATGYGAGGGAPRSAGSGHVGGDGTGGLCLVLDEF